MRGARLVLEQDGPKAVTFRGIAAVCGLSVGTISYYFPDRAALLEACLDPHAKRRKALMEELLEQIHARGPAAEVLAGIVDAALELAFGEQTLVRLRALTNAETRALRPDHAHDVRLPHLDQLGSAIAGHSGIEAVEARLILQTLNYAIGRYAELSDDELCRITSAASATEGRKLVGKHIHRCAAILLGPQRQLCDGAEDGEQIS